MNAEDEIARLNKRIEVLGAALYKARYMFTRISRIVQPPPDLRTHALAMMGRDLCDQELTAADLPSIPVPGNPAPE